MIRIFTMRVFTLIVVAAFWNQGTLAQSGSACRVLVADDTIATPIFDFPWIPVPTTSDPNPTINFRVNMRESTEMEIFLSPEPALVTPMYAINIGGDVADGDGDVDDDDQDAAIYRGDGTTTNAGTAPDVRADADGYITAGQTYDMYVSFNPATGSITVGKQGQVPIMSWTDDVSPIQVKWFGFGSVGTGDPSEWTFCEFAPERINIMTVSGSSGSTATRLLTIDGDADTCHETSSTSNAYLTYQFQEDYVVDMIIVDRNSLGTSNDDLEESEFFVGGCTAPTNNAQCGTPISLAENAAAEAGTNERRWIARCCQDFLIGRYVQIQRMETGNRQLSLCEVEVFGHIVTDEERATLLPTCSFRDTEYTVVEGTNLITITEIAPPFQYYACAYHSINVIDGTAVDDTDFSFNGPNADFPAPLTDPDDGRTVNVMGAFDDTIFTGDRQFMLELGYLRGCNIGTANTANVTIIDNDPLFTFSASKFTIAEPENNNNLQFDLQIIRAGYTQVQASVVLDYNSGITNTASVGSDFTTENTLPRQIDFEIDETIKFETITIFGNDLAELTETINFELQLVPTTGVGSIDATNGTTSVCIEDTDGATFSLADSSATVLESAVSYTVTVTRSGFSGDSGTLVYIATNGDTATEGSQGQQGADYQGLSSVPVTFAANQLSSSVSLSIFQDSDREGDEEFQVYLRLATLDAGFFIQPGQNVKSVTIKDDDYLVSLTSATYLGSEANGVAEVTVSRTENGGDIDFELEVGFGSGDTAVRGDDFYAGTISGTIPDGETSVTEQIVITDDDSVETTEQFTVRLSDVSAGVIDSSLDEAIISIIDDDGTYSLVSASSISENAGQLVVTVRRGGALVNRIGNVRISTEAFGAVDGVDYRGIDENIQFPIGVDSRDIAIPILDNLVTDSNVNRRFRLRLSDADGVLDPLTSEIVVIITDNDDTCSFITPTLEVAETDEVATLSIIRDGNTGGACTVRVSDGTAQNRVDYFTASTDLIINFLPGETQKPISFGIIDDTVPEPDKTFTVTLTGSSDGGINQITVVTITIQDDESQDNEFRFESPVYTIRESAGQFQINVLNTGDQGSVGLISRSTSASNAALSPEDFQAVGTTLQFGSGQFSLPFTIFIVDDDIADEGQETFELVLSNGQVAVVTIIDDGDGVPGGPAGGDGTSADDSVSPGAITGIIIGSVAGLLGVVLIGVVACVVRIRSNRAMNGFQGAFGPKHGVQQPAGQFGGFDQGSVYSSALVNNPMFNNPNFQSSYSPYDISGNFDNIFFQQQQQQQGFF